MSGAKFYREADADPAVLQGTCVAVLGYGNLGRSMALNLRDSGLEENTLVFYLSDNGGPTMPGTTVNASRNDPLRGSKRTTLEGGIRVPFVMQWKGKIPAGQTYREPVMGFDCHATALAAAGVELAERRKPSDVAANRRARALPQ